MLFVIHLIIYSIPFLFWLKEQEGDFVCSFVNLPFGYAFVYFLTWNVEKEHLNGKNEYFEANCFLNAHQLEKSVFKLSFSSCFMLHSIFWSLFYF